MIKKLAANLIPLAAVGIMGCASESPEPAVTPDASLDARAEARSDVVTDTVTDETSGGQDCCTDAVADAATDSPSDVGSDVIPDVAPEVGTDTAPPLPVRCSRSGGPDCSPFSAPGRCPDGPSEFSSDVNGAIDATMAAHPEWFQAAGHPACCPLILPLHINDYLQDVSDRLVAAGLCSSGPDEEMGVKFNNDCSESWDILANPNATTALVRRHYVGNCFPSFF